MDRFVLPFLVVFILALVTWALLDERKGDRMRKAREEEAAKEPPPAAPKRGGRR